MNDANEQQIEMLGTNLTVYETSAIQCKLTSEDKTLVFDVKLLIFISSNLICFLFIVKRI